MSTRYEEIGSSLALADIRAGFDPAESAQADVTAAAGLHEGDIEHAAILGGEVMGYEGPEGVERAQAEALRGYFAESATGR